MENDAQTKASARHLKTGLLAVADQNRVARLGDFWAELLQAGQDDEVALVQALAAVFLHVTRTGSLLLRSAATLSLRESAAACGHQEQCGDQGQFQHRLPSFFNEQVWFKSLPNTNGSPRYRDNLQKQVNHSCQETVRGIVRGTQALRIAAKFAAAPDFLLDCNILYSIVMT